MTHTPLLNPLEGQDGGEPSTPVHVGLAPTLGPVPPLGLGPDRLLLIGSVICASWNKPSQGIPLSLAAAGREGILMDPSASRVEEYLNRSRSLPALGLNI